MKFQPDSTQGPTITGYGPGWVAVNGQQQNMHLIVDSRSGSTPWNCAGFEALSRADFEIFLDFTPELVLFGSGDRIRFPKPEWLQSL